MSNDPYRNIHPYPNNPQSNPPETQVEEILYAFSNYWRENAHDTMPPGEYLTATQARKAILSLISDITTEAVNNALANQATPTVSGKQVANRCKGCGKDRTSYCERCNDLWQS